LPTAQWGAERAAAYRFLAKCDPENKEAHLKSSIQEDSGRRESYVDLAMYYYEQRNWAECYLFAEKALNIAAKPLDYLCEEFAWGYLPYDLASISSWNLGEKERALKYERAALDFEPNDIRMRENFATMVRELYPDKITAVIPTKSNIQGTLAVIDVLESDPQVLEIVVVLDGDGAAKLYKDVLKPKSKVSSFKVNEGSGIHVMWNIGLKQARKLGTSAVLINDDLTPNTNSAGILASVLAYDSTLGLVCPTYEDRPFGTAVFEDVTNARGAYDNTTGIAGCFMALSKPVVDKFNFDESMKWYYGDDDVVKWCNHEGYRTAITSITSFEGNDSYTTVNDPPKNFAEDIARDREIYESKWMR
jgi:tetratricopeptide (TPR) repeat protein